MEIISQKKRNPVTQYSLDRSALTLPLTFTDTI